MNLLPKSHRILERPFMEWRPFGKDRKGRTIQDVSGITVRANLEYLEDIVTRREGSEAAQRVLDRLVSFLNERIPDPTYHVTLDFLKNPWNSYSYEFVMFLAEFSVRLSSEEQFHFNLGREKFLSPIIQILGRPFSIIQIYRLYPYFVEKFTKGSLTPEVVSIRNGQAVMRLQFSEHAKQQFGPYFQGCAERICDTTKATIAEVPAKMFGQKPATIRDASCAADGAPYCEWTFTWVPQRTPLRIWHIISGIAALLTFGILIFLAPNQPIWTSVSLALLAAAVMQLAGRLWVDRTEIQEQRKIIQEQLEAAEHRHEDLREAYANQEHIVVEMRRRVEELTMLHHLTVEIGATLDRMKIIDTGLETLVRFLKYPYVCFAAWEPERQDFHQILIVFPSGEMKSLEKATDVPSPLQKFMRDVIKSREPSQSLDSRELWGSDHPMTDNLLLTKMATPCCLACPVMSQNQTLGVLLIGKNDASAFGTPECNLLATAAYQLALALDSALAYEEIEALNLGLEAKVQERTSELQEANLNLESANERLKELDRLKSQFLSHCSHELRTPLTSIKGFTQNLLQGMVGSLSDRQHLYLTRIEANSDRLTRMIGDLLDLSRIEAGTVRLERRLIPLAKIIEDATQELIPLIQNKGQQLTVDTHGEEFRMLGDPDRLHQIITNLIHNAHKFTPNNGTIRIEACHAPPHHISLNISDTGLGISSEAQQHLFQPFFQAHRRPEIGIEGLGLGLCIVKQLVDLHEGTISVQSEEGQGTTFRIQFPLPPAHGDILAVP